MKRIISYDEVKVICRALAHLSNAYALTGNFSKSNELVNLSDRLSDIAGIPEDYIKIEFHV